MSLIQQLISEGDKLKDSIESNLLIDFDPTRRAIQKVESESWGPLKSQCSELLQILDDTGGTASCFFPLLWDNAKKKIIASRHLILEADDENVSEFNRVAMELSKKQKPIFKHVYKRLGKQVALEHLTQYTSSNSFGATNRALQRTSEIVLGFGYEIETKNGFARMTKRRPEE